MIKILGWIIVSLVFIMGGIYPVKLYYSKTKDKNLLKAYKKLRVLHPILGIVIIILGSIHGFLALGTIRLHTGTIVLSLIIIMALISLLGQRINKFKGSWRPYHRYVSLILWIAIFIHIFYRNLI